MPYKSTADLPETAKGLPAGAKRIFMSAFNGAHKQYQDEEKAFKVAWSAVKKKYKKQGDKWVAKKQSALTAAQAVQATRQLYEACWQAGGSTKHRETILDLLKQAETEPAEHLERLQGLNDLCTPAFDLDQGYGTWGGGSHEHDFPGSLDHRVRVVCRAIHEQAKEYLGPYGYVLAVYPDFAVTCVIDDCCGDEAEYWRVDYQADDSGSVTIGDAEPVEVLTVVIPVGAMGGNSTEDDIAGAAQSEPSAQEGQQTNTDTPSDATHGKPKFDLAGTLNEDPQWHTTPEWIAQGAPPPGGDEELTQTYSAVIEQRDVDQTSGVMKIKGIATVGNVLNAMGEVYPTQVWQDNLPFLQEAGRQGALLGESDHPADQRPSIDRSCILWDNLWMDSDQLMFEARVLPTEPSGKNLQTLLLNGAKIDVSSRGRGTRKKGDWVNPSTGERYQDVFVVQRGFRCKTFDAVVNGASPGATITSSEMAQQTDANLAASTNEEVDVEKLDALAQRVDQMAAQHTQIVEMLSKLGQAAPPAAPVAGTATAVAEPPVQNQAIQPIPATDFATLASLNAVVERQKQYEPMLIEQRKQKFLDEARTEHNMPQQWLNSYRRAMEAGEPKTVEELEDVAKRALPIILSQYDARPRAPGNGIVVQADAGERAGPKTPGEMIEFLVKDLSDECPYNPFSFIQTDDEGNRLGEAPDWVKTPRRQVRKILQNVADYKDDFFNGKASLIALTRLYQGHAYERVQEDWMNQVCADGTTSVAAGGAPSSALFIFPLIRAVYPQLIASEIASVQPMDRPDGRIFFLNALRITPGVDSVDQAGTTLTDRTFVNNSSSFSTSYADRAAECDEAVKIQLRLASQNVTARSKALTTVNTIEELQDLRAYHGLDINSELMAAASREIAIEWNATILNEMAAGATAGTLTYGTTNAVGYTQKEWDEYIGRYVGAASNRIFRKRFGEATHLIAGPAAWEKLAAAFRVGTTGMGSNPTMYAGLTLTPFMEGAVMNLKAYKTGFWNSPTQENTILLIRRGADWSDTGYVFAPYVDYLSPILTLPDTFTQKQGVMSRAAHQVVIGDALAKIVIDSSVGQRL